MHIIGSDIGGAFTDLVLLDEKGNITISKSPSTPPEFAEGLMNALTEAAKQVGTAVKNLLLATPRSSGVWCPPACAGPARPSARRGPRANSYHLTHRRGCRSQP